uniref:Methanethiol oxidase n=3 Tax=Bursaphelenchus xylophilus TaxID=6326 RepID=A0A1I7SL85_BURXY
MIESLTDYFSSLTSRKPSACCDGGNKRNICFATPEEAMKVAKEKVIFVTCINTREDKKPDALMAVDVDPESKTYCQILCRLPMPSVNDEIHHSGWNACAGCVYDTSACRTHLLLPCLHSSNLYVIDTADPKDLKIHKTITHKDISHLNVSFLHTTHCMPSGDVMISTLGDNEGNRKCDMILLDSKTFEVKRSWCKVPSNVPAPKFHYDFWYQPKFNVLLSTEWGTPNNIKKGFNPADVSAGFYGNAVHVWEYTTGKLLQTITFHGDTGYMPLEVRFKHSPDQPHAFVGTALGTAIYHIYKENSLDPWQHELSVAIPAKEVEGWALPKMPGLVTDIIMSMDDKFLYVSLWLFGEVRQYNIEDPFKIKLTATAFIGGLITTESEVKVTHDPEKGERQPPLRIQHKKIEGGPQMMQLSLDGKRLYVTNSLYSVWDKGFYPEMSKNGGQMVKIDVDTVNGGMQVDPQFLIDFGKVEDGPYCPHEMRYPGGDCTSDIFVPSK